jgi:hypothetical protein
MHVRLLPDGSGRAAGKWSDEATGEHGDLLDVIRESCGLVGFKRVAEEARRFLSLPPPEPPPRPRFDAAPQGSPDAARRLFAASRPLTRTLADAYLKARGIVLDAADKRWIRFHPRCFYRGDERGPKQAHPALIAAVTDQGGAVTGIHRTWLKRGRGAAPASALDRRAMGLLLGHGVRFGTAGEVLAAGEGIETTLSLRAALADMPLIAALSAGHLGALAFPPGLRRLYVARDNDAAGDNAFARLLERGGEAGIDIVGLEPRHDDFNTDLVKLGADALARRVRAQLAGADAARFLAPER